MRLELRRTVAVIALGAVMATASSCAPAPAPSEPAFALTSAEVVVSSDRSYPVNLIFMAAEADPIWTELTGVELSDGASVGPGEFDVIRGEGTDGYLLGNITFRIDVPEGGISFDSVGLDYADLIEPTRVNVGSWTFGAARQEEFASFDAKAELAAMSRCTEAELPVPGDAASVKAFHTGSPSVDVEQAVLNPGGDALSIRLSCTDEADFHIFSPTLDYIDASGVEKSIRFAPIAIGYQDIDDEDLERIRER